MTNTTAPALSIGSARAAVARLGIPGREATPAGAIAARRALTDAVLAGRIASVLARDHGPTPQALDAAIAQLAAARDAAAN